MSKPKGTRQKPVKRSLAALKRDADRVFSLWVRKSHADAYGNVRCVTCGNRHPWKEIQCGHFVSRVHLSTRFETTNTAPQCFACNVWKRGNPAEFARYLIQQYGHSIIDTLCKRKAETLKITRAGYEDLIETYTQKIKALG